MGKKDKSASRSASKKAGAQAVQSQSKDAPPTQLLDLVESFLSQHSFTNAHVAFKEQRSQNGWETLKQVVVEKSGTQEPTLASVFETWNTTLKTNGTPTTERQAAVKAVEKVSSEDSSEDDTSSSESDEDEVDVKMEDASEKEEEEETSSSSGSESESESDDEEEEQQEPQVETVARTSLKRKAESESKSSSSESESDSDSDSSDSESSADEARPQVKRQKVKESKSESDSSSESESESESDSESDAEDEPATKQGLGADASDSSSGSDSSSDEESDSESESEDEDVQAAKVPLPESDSSDDSDSSSDSDSDSDSETETKTQPKAAPATNHDSDTSATVGKTSPQFFPVSTFAPLPPNPAPKSNNRGTTGEVRKAPNVPFSRVPKNIQVDPRLKSNAFNAHDWGRQAHEDLIVTKGKGFTKEKNKKKRGSYRGGFIDTSARNGIKFED